ncbi:MAG: membrane protein insertase YidC [Spirochaetales bacterium]|nr:membrane protein insertase YidC [Spirochaetales bacterium]
MLHILFQMLIAPLVSLLNRVLTASYELTGNYGLSILMMSAVINVLIYPFFALADTWQKEERLILDRMAPRRKDIREVFKGDEQYFYLKTLYRQNGYSPLLSIRSSFGMLIQIPFFIAAYRFLSGFEPLQGEGFLFLKDLSVPDGTFGMINLMPFVMTALNLASASVYSSGQSRSGKIQLFIMAGLFFVLLYTAPSGLLLYWSCNNFISLVKNLLSRWEGVPVSERLNRYSGHLLMKIKAPLWLPAAAVLYVCGSVGLYYLVKNPVTVALVYGAYFCTLILSVPALLYFLAEYKGNFLTRLISVGLLTTGAAALVQLWGNPFVQDPQDLIVNLFLIIVLCFLPSLLNKAQMFTAPGKTEGAVFLTSLAVLTVLAGLVVPTALAASSPYEMQIGLALIIQVLLWAFFSFALVPLFLYYALPATYRKAVVYLTAVVACGSVLNFLFFPGSYGVISESLQFEFGFVHDPKPAVLLNLAVLGGMGLFLLGVFLKTELFRFRQFLTLLLVSLLAMTGYNGLALSGSDRKEAPAGTDLLAVEPAIPLSRKAHNTIILFSDRALAGALPLALEAFPELEERYDGFTWYPDTLSFGVNTITSLPAMLGGYEYTPQGMAARPEESLKKKAFEGVMVLPRLFSDRNHRVYMANPLHKGFNLDTADLSVFDEMGIQRDDLSRVQASWLASHDIPSDFGKILMRDKSLFQFSLFRMAPRYVRRKIYDDGNWHSLNKDNPDYETYANLFNALSFYKEWAVLDWLPALMAPDEGGPTFSIIGNKASHEVLAVNADFEAVTSLIDYPEEDLALYGSKNSAAHIYTNVAVINKLADWLDWLKAEGLYDNTQILIVSDHGRAGEGVYDPYFSEDPGGDHAPEYVGFHPLMLFKPFGSRGLLGTSEAFMTNADTPELLLEAFGGADNPYTGKPLDSSAKEGPLLVGDGSNLIYNHGSAEYIHRKSYMVEKSMLDTANWRTVK